MRRVSAEHGDIFQPRGQVKRELELAFRAPEQVVRILGEQLSPERRARIDEVVARRTDQLSLAIDGVHDPHNTAAVIRTADVFGIQCVHVIEHQTRFLSSRKVTQGAHKWVDLGVWSTPKAFASAVRAQGKRILVAAADAPLSLFDLDPDASLALVFGNEAEGISPEMATLADDAFRIPMYGFSDSLNVSVAAAICAHTLRASGKGTLGAENAAVLRARFYLRAVRAGYDIVMRSDQASG